jgi:uncharacterized membrane protein
MFDLNHLHPMIVHFPVALIVVGFLLELLYLLFKKEFCLTKAGFYLMILGTLGAIAAFLTGEFFTTELTGNAGQVQETHELFAIITMITMIIATLIRVYLFTKNKETTSLKWIVFSLYAVGAMMVGITGFFGGSLVYNYLIGL